MAHILSYGLLVMLLILPQTFGQFRITNPPKNYTVLNGDFVQLDCDISGSSSQVFQWTTYKGSTVPQDRNIYTCSPKCQPTSGYPSSKYMMTDGQYTLNISGVDWTDGAKYACRFLGSTETTAFASIVVIDHLAVSIREPDLQAAGAAVAITNSSSTGSQANSSTGGMTSQSSPGYLHCSVFFGAPVFTDPQLRLDRMPRLRMSFKGVDYSANASQGTLGSKNIQVEFIEGVPGQKPHVLKMTVASNLTKDDIGQELVCTVSTVNPSFSSSNSTVYAVDGSGNWDIEVKLPEHTDMMIFYIDDVIDCSVPQQPNAFVQWTPLEATSRNPVYSSSLNITQQMVGYNHWKCSAMDSRSRVMATYHLQFNVTDGHRGDNNQNMDDDDSAKRIGLGVGLGLGLGLLVIVIIIIVIVMLKRRGGRRSPPAKNGKTTVAATGTSSYAPLAAEPEPHNGPPIYQPKTNSQPLGRNTSPVPSEEPSMNQSGHGDLGGVGFKPASLPSRSNSNLNASADRPLISLSGQPAGQDGVRPGGYADIGGPGLGPRAPVAYADSQDSTSAISVPRSASVRSSASSVNPNRSGPTYRQPAPRSGQATGV